MPNLEGKVERVWTLMGELPVPIVVTHESMRGHLRARPMLAHPSPRENAILFLTGAHAAKDDEIQGDRHVCVTVSDFKSQKYLCLTGLAELSNDRERISRLWSNADAAFWSDANDPSIRLLTFVPAEAEYWETSDALAGFVHMFKAALGGGAPTQRVNEKLVLG